VEKARYVQQAGVRGVVMQNKNNLLEAPEAADPRVTIPVLLIVSGLAAKALQKYVTNIQRYSIWKPYNVPLFKVQPHNTSPTGCRIAMKAHSRVLPTAYGGTGVAIVNATDESDWGINPPSITFPGKYTCRTTSITYFYPSTYGRLA
jgi:hypothetical protein